MPTCCNEFLNAKDRRHIQADYERDFKKYELLPAAQSHGRRRDDQHLPRAPLVRRHRPLHAAEQDRRSRSSQIHITDQHAVRVDTSTSTGRSISSAAHHGISIPSTRSTSRSQPGEVADHDLLASATHRAASATATSRAQFAYNGTFFDAAISRRSATMRTSNSTIRAAGAKSIFGRSRKWRRAATRCTRASICSRRTPDWITYPHHRQHFRRSDRHRARLSAARVDAERPPLLRIQHGRHAHLWTSSPTSPAAMPREGGLQRPERARESRGLLRPGAHVRHRRHARELARRARLLSGELQPVSVHAISHHGISALPHLRAVLSEHRAVLRRHRLHRADAEADRRRSHVLRHGARARPPVVGPPAHRRRRAGLEHDVRDARAVLRVHGDAAESTARTTCTGCCRHYLDRYLRGRAGETRHEPPLALVQRETYVWYEKGGQIMYTLADYIGEDKVNLALHNFLMQYRYANAHNQVDAADSTRGAQSMDGRYPDTRMLVDALRAQTPPELQYLIDDGFNRIVLYDNKALSATSQEAAERQIRGDARRAGAQGAGRRQRRRDADAARRLHRHRRLQGQEGRGEAALHETGKAHAGAPDASRSSSTSSRLAPASTPTTSSSTASPTTT